jgi:phosphoribosyl-ATP pyrophosphohydrolase
MADDMLGRLYATILSKRGADPSSSYTAKLFQSGTPKIAQKVGEESVEVVIEALRQRPDRLVAESADLLYHLLVLWADAGIAPERVWAELARREGFSGYAHVGAETPESEEK